MEALEAQDPENDDSFTFLIVFSDSSWRLLKALGAQNPENDDSFTFLMVFSSSSWRLLEPKTPKMTTVSRF